MYILHSTDIFSYENDTCSYYSAWLDPNEVGQEDGANLEGKLFFTRTDGPGKFCFAKTTDILISKFKMNMVLCH